LENTKGKEMSSEILLKKQFIKNFQVVMMKAKMFLVYKITKLYENTFKDLQAEGK